ncbi:MAG: 4-hydroxy-tetrahydrodipicolinate synthase [Desulfobacterales bacterium]|jgi:4-hydroxy-tetrahydrodipicolinate synthase
MKAGAYTAIITPFDGDGVDEKGLDRLVEFQIQNGITGVLAVGTTGESPALTWTEHNRVVESVAKRTRGRCLCVAGTGSNNTREALQATEHAMKAGVQAVLLVDPYYNGPSSLEIRREYIGPIAEAYPSLEVIPYVIPGRTGTQLLPEDLALLSAAHPNVQTVKEATGNLDNMRRTRRCCGPGFTILSGDDGVTFDMMTDADIGAAGVISVIANIVPGAVAQMVEHLRSGDEAAAQKLHRDLSPLYGLVTVNTTESTPHGEVVCRARNPLAIKSLMAIFGMPSGPCRRPLGKMTRSGIDVVLRAARTVHQSNPDLFAPAEVFFGFRVEERLETPANWSALFYGNY